MRRTVPCLDVAAGLALGYLADEWCGDPRRGHPVALFGRAAAALEARLWADHCARGLAYGVVGVGGPTLLAAGLDRLVREKPRLRTVYVASLVWAALGGRSLRDEGAALARLLESDDVVAARRRLGHLCARDAAHLGTGEIARAAVESLAENTADAVVAPLLWGALAGPAGIVGYRCANTLDAMVGYRSVRYRRFGWASARLDDALNVVPARLTAALTVLLAPAVGGSPAAAWRAWRRDAAAHPSPNAGPVEASAAGALGVCLGGSNAYDGRVEDRGRLGDGPPAGPADLPRAVRLSRLVGAAGAGLAVVLAAALPEHRRASPGGRGRG